MTENAAQTSATRWLESGASRATSCATWVLIPEKLICSDPEAFIGADSFTVDASPVGARRSTAGPPG